MPLMSRFRKDKKDDAEADETAAELEEDKDAGLFMANDPQPDQAPAEGGQAGADDLLEASSGEAASPEGGASDDLASETPVPTTEDEGDSSQSPRPSTAEEPTSTAGLEEPTSTAGLNVKTVPASESATDDLMSAFRTGGDEVETSGLMKEIEDIPIDELLADMREIVELLGLTVPEVDDSDELQEAV